MQGEKCKLSNNVWQNIAAHMNTYSHTYECEKKNYVTNQQSTSSSIHARPNIYISTEFTYERQQNIDWWISNSRLEHRFLLYRAVVIIQNISQLNGAQIVHV